MEASIFLVIASLLVLLTRAALGALIPVFPAHPMHLNNRLSAHIPINSVSLSQQNSLEDMPLSLDKVETPSRKALAIAPRNSTTLLGESSNQDSKDSLPLAPTQNNDDETPSRRALAIAPRNAAAVVGESIQLVCEVGPDPAVPRVIWVEFISRSGGEVITSDKEVMNNHPHAHRYSVLPGSSTQFNLQIVDLQLHDGGRYLCEDTVSSSEGSAELVIIQSEPSCEATFSSSNGVVVEGQQHTITCTVNFQTHSIIPSMTWQVPWQSSYKVEETPTETSVKSKISFEVTRVMHGTSVSCKTSFNAPTSVPPHTASNAPHWQHVYNSTTLKVV